MKTGGSEPKKPPSASGGGGSRVGSRLRSAYHSDSHPRGCSQRKPRPHGSFIFQPSSIPTALTASSVFLHPFQLACAALSKTPVKFLLLLAMRCHFCQPHVTQDCRLQPFCKQNARPASWNERPPM